MHSLKTRLFTLWALSLLASVAVGGLLFQLYQQSAHARVGRAEALVARACDLIRGHYDFYTADWSGPVPPLTNAGLRADLTAIVAIALSHQPGIAGGIWQADTGPLAYADPTDPGTPPSPQAPPAIQQLNQQAAAYDQPISQRTATATQTILSFACPLPGPIDALTAWTTTTVPLGAGIGPLQLGVGVLLALLVIMAIWLGRTLLVWGRHVHGIEAALEAAGPGGMPQVPRTGERELDRIIDALNDAGRRLGEAQRDAVALTDRAARAERLAALGRVAAGVAHEIRNPIAAARLQGENALAGDDARRRTAIGDMLGQIDRLDTLVTEMLAMTQRAAPTPVRTDLPTFLTRQAAGHKETAAAAGVKIAIAANGPAAAFDPAVVGRILDNLLSNAIRHTPPGGTVSLAAKNRPGSLSFTVADTGPGIPPDLANCLFEPFVTGRPDGTGLGLAIARELAEAHGGRLHHVPGQAGAIFVLDLPQEATWPPS
jgi:signal transduction histidine kinase